MTEEEYTQNLEQLEKDSEELPIKYILVDGFLLLYPVPNSDPNYDGGKIEFGFHNVDEGIQENKSFANFEEYLDWIREDEKQYGFSDEEIESKIIAQINASLRNCFGRLNNERIKMKRPGNSIFRASLLSGSFKSYSTMNLPV